MDTRGHVFTLLGHVGVKVVIFNLSINGPSLEAILFTDDRNEIVMVANLSLDESSYEVVVLTDDESEDSDDSTEIWKQ